MATASSGPSEPRRFAGAISRSRTAKAHRASRIINEPLAVLGNCVLLPPGKRRGGECVTVVGVRAVEDSGNTISSTAMCSRSTFPLHNARSSVRWGDRARCTFASPATRRRWPRQFGRRFRVCVPISRRRRSWRCKMSSSRRFDPGVSLRRCFSSSAAWRSSSRSSVSTASSHSPPRSVRRKSRCASPLAPSGCMCLAAVAGDGLRAIASGLAAGSALALVVQRWVGPLLFQTSPSDPGVIAAAAALLLGVAVLGIAVPTWRALRQNPAAILRME